MAHLQDFSRQIRAETDAKDNSQKFTLRETRPRNLWRLQDRRLIKDRMNAFVEAAPEFQTAKLSEQHSPSRQYQMRKTILKNSLSERRD